MAYTVKYEHPHFPEGTMFNVGGLDRVPNGGTLEIDEDTERNFLYARGLTLEDAFSNDHAVTLSGASALDKSEVSDILAAVNPVPEVEEEPAPETTTSSWAAPSNDDKEEGEQ
jgi:hypothetical protein